MITFRLGYFSEISSNEVSELESEEVYSAANRNSLA